MDRYLILLTGMGDVHVSFVTKETWDWLNSDSMEMPAAMRAHKIKIARKWNKERNRGKADEEIFEDYYGAITEDVNDRALLVGTDFRDDPKTVEPLFTQEIFKAFQWATENQVNIVGAYEGAIY